MYYIYHIPTYVWKDGSIGKIGCTTDTQRRVNEQGYTDFETLESYTDIYIASDRELYLQKQYGYRVDTIPYYHSYEMQKLGCSIGGKISTMNYSSDFLKSISPLGNKANIEKYGKKVITTNIKTNESFTFHSIREAERVLNIQAPLIRRCLNNLQPKSKGYTFQYL
jgi:hypothetical protein